LNRYLYRMGLMSYLSSLIPVPPALEARISGMSKKIKVSKNELIVHVGERCSHLYFIGKGCLRGYYLDDGKDITNWFAQENEFATCFYAFVAGKPSFEFIQALEDCELVQLSRAGLQELYTEYPETERIGRIITEDYYIRLEERLLSIRFKTAKERYRNLVEFKPALLQRASLGQIATYLGITQETLSRIRSEA
jgi:CRP-like cAMP-binding protein